MIESSMKYFFQKVQNDTLPHTIQNFCHFLKKGIESKFTVGLYFVKA